LRGLSGHPEGITYPIILGSDAAGTLDDGTPAVIYPVMGDEDWHAEGWRESARETGPPDRRRCSLRPFSLGMADWLS